MPAVTVVAFALVCAVIAQRSTVPYGVWVEAIFQIWVLAQGQILRMDEVRLSELFVYLSVLLVSVDG